MRTTEECLQNLREFEEKRKAEGYADDTGTVLKRFALIEYTGDNGLKFHVQAGVEDGGARTEDGKRIGWHGNGTWEARLEDRGVVVVGATPEEAIALLIKNTAEDAVKGYFDPNNPVAIGVPPVQHCLNILSAHLAWHLERRSDALRDRGVEEHKGGDFRGASYMDDGAAEKASDARTTVARRFDPLITHHNEAISALGTAVSALARVKDL